MTLRDRHRGAPATAAALVYVDRSDCDLLHDSTDPAESFAVFYQRHVAGVIRFAASRGLDADTAADVVADTFIAALTSRMRYRPERENAMLWLLAIASRRIADRRRYEGRDRRRFQRLQSEAIVLTQSDRDSYRRAVDDDDGPSLDALSDLPVLQQRAIRARVIEHHEYAEIAEALGLSQPATRQQVSRGLARLRTILKEKP
jgi:RNA polymerase sigma-70 factor (ECF subfamily)